MKNRLNQFILNTQGQFIEVSYKEAEFQCMDLAYLWAFCLGLPKGAIQHQYAYQVFTSPNDLTREYFDIIKNTPDFIPQDGDIGVFEGGTAGHIVVCLSGGTTKTFPCFEQNTPLGSNAHITPNKSYTNFLGVLRPKVNKLDFVITDQTVLPIIDSNGNKMEVGACKSLIGDLENQSTNLLTKIDTLNSEIVQLTEKVAKTPQITLQEPTGPSENTITVPTDSFDTSSQKASLSLWQELAEIFKKLLRL